MLTPPYAVNPTAVACVMNELEKLWLYVYPLVIDGKGNADKMGWELSEISEYEKLFDEVVVDMENPRFCIVAVAGLAKYNPTSLAFYIIREGN